MYLLLLANC